MNLQLVAVIQTYPWQCMECKTCIICRDPFDEVSTYSIFYLIIFLWHMASIVLCLNLQMCILCVHRTRCYFVMSVTVDTIVSVLGSSKFQLVSFNKTKYCMLRWTQYDQLSHRESTLLLWTHSLSYCTKDSEAYIMY